ncbi:hypothetical protein EJ04DRAFT_168915 [Polyplosphaeria fusca]|uniref:Tail specific protease domain-containing protein n=1 Tax=Polyplosphaeria fusca TaxID=682080 RepID=A0A9P4R8D7_9PLEO|nr:hypothetical protein EJ04DRAFT_168915 [Polyplosphaeria fusca]
MLISTLLLASAAIVAAQTETETSTEEATATRTSTPSATGEPCAVIASLVADSNEGFGSPGPDLPAASAFACLKSVPVDVEGDSKLIDELKLVWQWQSEIAYLKNTPSEWEYGSLDAEAELDKIKAGLANFSSEYDVQTAIQDIVTKSGNYHWNYTPDILQIFQWTRAADLVALSSDGTSLPKIYDKDDANVLKSGRNGSVSAIKEINGVEAGEYVLKLASLEQYIDSDGRLNSMWYKGDTESMGTFQFQTRYDGPSTKFTFENGTEVEYDNVASTDVSGWEDVSDGKSFFSVFCDGATAGFSKDNNDIKEGRIYVRPSPHIPAKGRAPSTYHTININKRQSIPSTYPDAIEAASDGSVAGYFLEGDEYDDVAVLKIITFSPDGDSSGNEFQTVIKEFLQKCIDEKKQKLIIDLRENGGGATHLLLDSFMQLFPDEIPFSGQRYRAMEQFLKIGDAVDEISNSENLLTAFEVATDSNLTDLYRFWHYQDFVNAQGENFKSWDDFNGPLQFNEDNFTAIMRYNYSNSNDVSIRPEDFLFTTGSRPTPFKAENVVMFTDALCGSSCASFHEELKNIAGVKAVTVGGRPENKPIQTVTGTKGGEVLPLYYFTLFASQLIDNSQDIGIQTALNNTQVNDLASVTQVLKRAGDGRTRIQAQDQIRKGEKNGVALQYIYEASDCKIFYTKDTYSDPEAAWMQAWDAFTDDKKCVEGSTGHKSSISGGYKPFGPGDLKDTDLPQSNNTGNSPPSGTPTPNATQPASPTSPTQPTAPSNSDNAAARYGGSAAFGLVVAAAVALM